MACLAPNQSAFMRVPLYGRLGNDAILRQKIAEARQNGAVVDEDLEAGTVEAKYNEDILFKAMQKNTNSWIIMYNPVYYPRH